MSAPNIEDLLRPLAPQVLGALVRRYGHFDLAEDAVQEALLAASQQWPDKGTPGNARGWLIRVAAHKLTDLLRSDDARRRREESAATLTPRDAFVAPPPGAARAPSRDDTVTLLVLCCHPALSSASRIALTLRAVAGLSTAEIAHAFLVPQATMAQRISRAKQTIEADGARFERPRPGELPERLRAVLHVLYLIFNEGYTVTSGMTLTRVDLTGEAIRLARELRELMPDNNEVAGLLALMLLIDARREARTTSYGAIIPLLEQDRSKWNQGLIAEGTAILEEVLPRGAVGAYQLQAAIAAVHDEAAAPEDTDWPQILGLYQVLEKISVRNPVVALNRAVATGMVEGPEAGLALLASVADDKRLASSHRVAATRAFLLERAGDVAGAAAAYRKAADQAGSLPEQRFLTAKATSLEA